MLGYMARLTLAELSAKASLPVAAAYWMKGCLLMLVLF